MEHPNPEVQAAIDQLDGALTTWERSTGRQSVLILREQGGFVHRTLNGKPVDESLMVSDTQLVMMLVGD